MGARLFGTDGVRGKVGEEPVTPATILKLGWAAGKVFAKACQGEASDVLIGKDTRISGYLFESALEAGFSAAGINIALLGPLPTPAVAYLTRTAREACAGVMISASHNPYDDNGIKFFSATGSKPGDALIAEIERMMEQPMRCVSSQQLGKARRFTDSSGRYIEHCKNTFPETQSLSGMTVVVDCANGAAYDLAPRIFTELGANVVALANQPDGFNINHGCGAMDMAQLQQTVVEQQADIGVALDGDADRVLLVDSHGQAINGDQILYVLARHRQAHGRLAGGVAGTQMTNLGLEIALNELAIPFIRTPVGDRYIHEALVGAGWNLGGENSGHIICLDKTTTGDGIVTALEVLEVMLQSGRSLVELTKELTIFHQRLVNVDIGDADGTQLATAACVHEAVKAAEAKLGKCGRIVLRPSGTEPVFRVMLEGEATVMVDELTHQIVTAVKQASNDVRKINGWCRGSDSNRH